MSEVVDGLEEGEDRRARQGDGLQVLDHHGGGWGLEVGAADGGWGVDPVAAEGFGDEVGAPPVAGSLQRVTGTVPGVNYRWTSGHPLRAALLVVAVVAGATTVDALDGGWRSVSLWPPIFLSVVALGAIAYRANKDHRSLDQ
jgi:hypothetical protein